MNKDEQIVFNYLLRKNGSDVIFEPNGNIPPDFLVDTSFAIEVRRLNQQFFSKGKSEGLETLSHQLFSAFKEVLVSFDTMYSGKSYWVYLRYKRPCKTSIKETKKLMRNSLLRFINLENVTFPHNIRINKRIFLEVCESLPIEGRIFRPGGRADHDAGGFVVSTYIENISHCIHEKSEKIKNVKIKHKFWQLFLVDHLNLGLDGNEIVEVKNLINNLEKFDKLVLVSLEGNLVFEMNNPISNNFYS